MPFQPSTPGPDKSVGLERPGQRTLNAESDDPGQSLAGVLARESSVWVRCAARCRHQCARSQAERDTFER
eukprot:3103445-Rhodomonas_salina.1